MEQHRYTPHDYATSNVLAWTTTNSANVEPSVEEDAGADTDEPPDCPPPMSPVSNHFKRTAIRRGSEQHESLLTKAFQSHSDEESHDATSLARRRRRSITSNFSIASTAELTCDTGLTTPARTSSPSPRFSSIGFVPLMGKTPVPVVRAERDSDAAVQALAKKRCISFACAAKPKTDDKVSMPPPPKPTDNGTKSQAAPKKTTIKFACPAAPPKTAGAQTRPMTPVPRDVRVQKPRTPSTVRARPSTPRRTSNSPIAIQSKKWIAANANDLDSENAHFHEFASETPQEDDWIRHDDVHKPKLTIQDTLQKEMEIRKLGKEAEEEAEAEEEELDEEVDEDEDGEEDEDDDESPNGDDGDDDDDLDDEADEEEVEEEEEDDVNVGYNWDDEASDGYKTDNEIGFAESDDEDDGLLLWTTRVGHHQTLSGAVLSAVRRLSVGESSDSSAGEGKSSLVRKKTKRSRSRPVPFRPATPELPDSTDFVCGTLDEDRPLEDAYISCVEARKRDKVPVIPQDIDPSFPTSDIEDEPEEPYGKGYGESDEHGWLHGEFEDLHHERDRRGRKSGKGPSPKRFRSPPPKRRLSPAPKMRGRSPLKPTERASPRRFKSPAPISMAYRSSASSSPGQDSDHVAFKALAFRPGLGLPHTKSLPKAPGMFLKQKARKAKVAAEEKDSTHVRGAIDIVKGLEQKRQRRKEKYYQKYCSRARKEKAKEKAHPKRTIPGEGAERMRELGLTMAGKNPGHYVLSI
ncbi:uncharacterized protein PODANS_7_2160 [Podospora anserina S mat+]|uniref:Podospora anserina S mat+ genomic DNA chromosome 7, supercontig 1 n=1 Tax=Podospora anserina (strain S / ATCC MYA-4624 / DSM 980 / FGSC 10383) TaxID=515849 RepID=B2AVQ3_PODAN|nr:uncharacterized protein PODANS_7_2160 [Podospora anserina S mat+]CAP68477.1 unnamed protein product [Podospora anserina S mat+]CDP31949.1 Putative protein of unknown function [Podospora anserina S mat+]